MEGFLCVLCLAFSSVRLTVCPAAERERERERERENESISRPLDVCGWFVRVSAHRRRPHHHFPPQPLALLPKIHRGDRESERERERNLRAPSGQLSIQETQPFYLLSPLASRAEAALLMKTKHILLSSDCCGRTTTAKASESEGGRAPPPPPPPQL